VGWARNPFFLAITLAAMSVGLVVPILADAGLSETVLGQLTIAGATAGEFGAITLLSLFFPPPGAGPPARSSPSGSSAPWSPRPA
jgi:Kef-type K+ transport system membrane component KefB